MRRYVFDARQFSLLFAKEGSNKARLTALSRLINERLDLLTKDVKPEDVIESAYATLNVLSDEEATFKLEELKTKYRDKPWENPFAVALSLRLNERGRVSVAVLNREKHLDDIEEIRVNLSLDYSLTFKHG